MALDELSPLYQASAPKQHIDNIVDAAELLEAPDRQHTNVGPESLHSVLVAFGMAGNLRTEGKCGLSRLGAEPEIGTQFDGLRIELHPDNAAAGFAFEVDV